MKGTNQECNQINQTFSQTFLLSAVSFVGIKTQSCCSGSCVLVSSVGIYERYSISESPSSRPCDGNPSMTRGKQYPNILPEGGDHKDQGPLFSLEHKLGLHLLRLHWFSISQRTSFQADSSCSIVID